MAAPAENCGNNAAPGTQLAKRSDHATAVRDCVANCTAGLIPPETHNTSAATSVSVPALPMRATRAPLNANDPAVPTTWLADHTVIPRARAAACAAESARGSTTPATVTPASCIVNSD